MKKVGDSHLVRFPGFVLSFRLWQRLPHAWSAVLQTVATYLFDWMLTESKGKGLKSQFVTF